MEIDSSGLRKRKGGIQKLVEDLDIFEKVVDNVKEEKKISSGLISFICFAFIAVLVFGELHEFFIGKRRYDYRFDVDTDLTGSPNLAIDMVVATSCNSLSASSSLDQTGGIFAPLQETIKKDPTRFEFTDEEQMYWTVLRHAHAQLNNGGQRGLEELQYIDSDVEETLEHLADEKQREEAAHIQEDRKHKKGQGRGDGQVVFMVGNGMGMFQLVATNGVDEGTACRIHGKFPVRKGKEEKIIISIGGGIAGIFAHMDGSQQKGNISHRIEKFTFGPRISGLVAPLAGAEQISLTGQDVYRYFIKVVPTKIYSGMFGGFTMAYQYSTTFLKKQINEGEHSHGGILFEYEFSATVIEIREREHSLLVLLVRLCAIVGGVFATSSIINSLVQLILSMFSTKKTAPLVQESFQQKVSLLDSAIRVH